MKPSSRFVLSLLALLTPVATTLCIGVGNYVASDGDYFLSFAPSPRYQAPSGSPSVASAAAGSRLAVASNGAVVSATGPRYETAPPLRSEVSTAPSAVPAMVASTMTTATPAIALASGEPSSFVASVDTISLPESPSAALPVAAFREPVSAPASVAAATSATEPLLCAADSPATQNSRSIVNATDTANSYFAEGINAGNITASERFYDSGKGAYWLSGSTGTMGEDRGYKAFAAAWQANYEKAGDYANMDFLGDWATVGTARGQLNQEGIDYAKQCGIDAYAVKMLLSGPDNAAQMTGDGLMCWAHAVSNVIQYWQTYYGIFAQDAANLPYGYAVADKEAAVSLLGIQSLAVERWHYLQYPNRGGYPLMALQGYLGGNEQDQADGPGKFFSNYYYGDYAMTQEVNPSGSREVLTTGVRKLLGFTTSGAIEQSIKGQLAVMSIVYESGGHAVTLYGFGLGEDGLIDRLFYANSDDTAYGMQTFYVREENGKILLYDDADYSTYAASLSSVAGIVTSDTLKSMYAQYEANDLTWQGTSRVWEAGTGTGDIASALPTAATGWGVRVNNTYYAAYFDAARGVVFNDDSHDGSEAVSIKGQAQAAKVTFNTVAEDLNLTSHADGGTLTTDTLLKTGDATATLSQLSTTAAKVNVSAGVLCLGSGAALQATSGLTVARNAALKLDGGTLSGASAVISSGGTLELSGTGSVLATESLTLADNSSLLFSLTEANRANVALTLQSGHITWGSGVTIDVTGEGLSGSYQLATFTAGASTSWLEHMVCYNGTLGFSGNTLTLTYSDPRSSTWSNSSPTWSAETWAGAESANAVFDGSGSSTVTVEGTVNPGAVNISSGSYTFGGTGHISGNRALSIFPGASLTAELDLGGRSINVGEKDSEQAATFIYDTTGQVAINELNVLNSASTATLQGDAVYDTEAFTMKGAVTVGDTARLVLRSSGDFTFTESALLSVGKDATLVLRNSSSTGDVTYTSQNGGMTDGSWDAYGAQGSIRIGDAADAYGTTLIISELNSMTFTIEEGSTLQLNACGDGDFGGSISGEGTLKVAAGNSVTADTRADMLKDIRVTVEGTLNVKGDMDKTVTVNNGGVLHAERRSNWTTAVGTMADVVLNGGTLKSAYNSTVELLEVNNGGTLSASGSAAVTVNQLSGQGTLSLATDSRNTDFEVTLGEALNFNGDIAFTAGYSRETNPSSKATSQTLRLGNVSADGVLSLLLNGTAYTYGSTDTYKDWQNKGAIILQGNASVCGVKDTFAGSGDRGYNQVRLAGETEDSTSRLSIDTKGSDYTFTGHIGSGLSLSKQGEGTQSFSGDFTAFNGSLEVKQGTLTLTSEADRQSSWGGNIYVVEGLNSSDELSVKNLDLSAGAVLESNMTLAVEGAFASHEEYSTIVGLAGSVSLTAGEAATAATAKSDLDLSGVSSASFGSTVSLDGHNLVFFEQAMTLTLEQSLVDSVPASQISGDRYNVVLFSDIGELTWAGSGIEGPFYASWLFTGDAITEQTLLVYDSEANTLSLEGALVPESSSAALSLLALAGLASRRRRVDFPNNKSSIVNGK